MSYNYNIYDYTGNEEKITSLLPEMFDILATNMTKIAKTGNTLEEDWVIWTNAMKEEMKKNNKRWIFAISDRKLIGFMLFRLDYKQSIAYMDEIQIHEKHQGDKVLFPALFGAFLFHKHLKDITYLRSYANKKNIKSNAILNCLGLARVEETERGYKYLGNRQDSEKWFLKKYTNFIYPII